MADKIAHTGQAANLRMHPHLSRTGRASATSMETREPSRFHDHDREEVVPGSGDPHTPRLAIEIGIETVTPPAWISRSIDLLLAADHVDVTEVTVRASDPQSTTGSRSPVRSIFQRLDARVFGGQPDPVAPSTVPASMARNDATPDVTLLLGSGFRGHLAAVRPVWTIEFGTEGRHDPDDAAMRALVAGETMIEARLVEHVRNQLPVTLATCVTGTSRHSARVTRDRLLWASVSLPVRASRQRGTDRHAGKEDATARHPPPVTARAIVRTGARAVRTVTTRLISETEWILAYSRSDDHPAIDAMDAEHCASFTIARQPADRFWADPFPVVDNGRHWIFVEEWMHGAPHAHLAVIDVRDDGSLGPSVPILEKPYHLSYPHVFRWMGEVFMIPETRSNRTIELYRSVRFPFDWRLECVLMHDLDAVDASVIEIDGRWWMFVAIAPEHGVENDQLHLFSAETPLGPWNPHPMNPVVSDVRRARPAGRVFRDATGWIRPSQDCSVRYGYAIGFNRITSLSETAYAEERVSTILPAWTRGIEGTHTFNRAGGLTVIDASRPRFRLLLRK